MNTPLIEACVDSYASCRAAWLGGADRLELCAHLVIGGTTPSTALFRQVQRDIPVKTNVLIRPRFGDFLYSKEELAGLAEVLAKYPNIIVLSDEIYEHINYVGAHESIAQFESIRDRVVVINGVSKAYAMTGWRIGFIAAPLWIAKACNKLQGQYTSGPCSVAQKAAEVAFSGDQSCVAEMRNAFLRRRDLVVKLCKDIPGIKINNPQGAFYLFPEVSSYYGKKAGDRVIQDAGDLAMYLLEEGHVATVGGAAFGAPECIRFSYATSDENLVEAIKRIKKALAALK